MNEHLAALLEQQQADLAEAKEAEKADKAATDKPAAGTKKES